MTEVKRKLSLGSYQGRLQGQPRPRMQTAGSTSGREGGRISFQDFNKLCPFADSPSTFIKAVEKDRNACSRKQVVLPQGWKESKKGKSEPLPEIEKDTPLDWIPREESNRTAHAATLAGGGEKKGETGDLKMNFGTGLA